VKGSGLLPADMHMDGCRAARAINWVCSCVARANVINGCRESERVSICNDTTERATFHSSPLLVE
jgi:hypothetical protein